MISVNEDWGNDAENSAPHHGKILEFKIYSNRKLSFEIVTVFHNITVFAVFLFKCSFCENKSLKKNKKM